MTRDEFIDKQKVDAESLRTKVLADPTANPALLALAADKDGWSEGFLAALEEAGLLRPDDQAPPSAASRKSRVFCRYCPPAFSTARPASRLRPRATCSGFSRTSTSGTATRRTRSPRLITMYI
jgi:hypothetical protein